MSAEGAQRCSQQVPAPSWSASAAGHLGLDESLMGGVLGPVWGVEEYPWAPPIARQWDPLTPSLLWPQCLQTLLYFPLEGNVLPVCEPQPEVHVDGWVDG